MKTIEIYTDGGATPNPGAGGWAAVLIWNRGPDQDPVIKELSGGVAHATNNEMELAAAISALEALKQPCHVKLHTDSTWLIGAMNGNKRKQHREQLQKLDELCKIHQVEWIYVQGHVGNTYNERAHWLADNAKPMPLL